MLCNWSFWLYIGETGGKINCLPWWGNTRKTRYQRLFWSQRVSAGKEWKIELDTATNTHCIYLVSGRILRGRFDGNSSPLREISEASTRRCFHRWPVSPSGSLQRRPRYTTTGVPEGLPCSAQFEPPIIYISLEENRVEDEIVSMCIARKGKTYGQPERVMHYCMCNHHTLLRAPWHHFPSHDQLVCCNNPQTLLNTHALSPESVEAAVTAASPSPPAGSQSALWAITSGFGDALGCTMHQQCVCARPPVCFSTLWLPPQWDTGWELMGNMHSGNRRPEGGTGRKWGRDFWLSQYNMIAGFNLFLIMRVVSE